MRLWVQIPFPPYLFDFPLLFKKSDSCNHPTLTIDDTKKVYISTGVLEDSQVCKVCWVGGWAH